MPVVTPGSADREKAMNDWANKPDPTPAASAAPPGPASPPAAPKPAEATPPANAAPAASGAAPAVTDPALVPATPSTEGGPSDWLVFKKGTEEFRVPVDAAFEFKRRDETLTRTADEFRREGMMGTDYKLAKETLASERQRFQQEREQEAVARARMQERERFLQEQETALREAQTDPQKFEQWQVHMEQMRSNPLYRKAFEDSLAKRETDAEVRVLRERAESDYLTRATATVEGWTEALKAKYPGVPVDAVQRDYAAQVTLFEQQMGRVGRLGEGPLTPAALEAVFQHHAGIYNRVIEPVNGRVAALEAELKALKDQKAVEAANAQTQHAVKRAAAPSTAPVRGTPGAEAPRKPSYESETDREERMAKWIAK